MINILMLLFWPFTIIKSEVLTYNSITLEGDPIIYGNYTYKQYKITDSKNESHYIVYQIENSNPENIKEIYSSTKKMLFLIKDEIVCVIDHEVFDESDGYPVDKEMLLIYPTGEIKESTITYFSTIGVYGECTYKQYVIDGLSGCYAVLGWKTSDPHNPYIVIRSDSWIYNDTITNVGMIFTDNRRINANSTSYTTKVANTSGTISTATVSQRNTFTYGTYTYRQYSITGNSKTEYVMYQINTSTPTTFSNILMCDARIYNNIITNVGVIFTDNRRIRNNNTTYITLVLDAPSGTISTATVSQRNTFTYGSYTYRQYAITGNGKTEYVMYQIDNNDTNYIVNITFSNILMSDSWIFNDNITNVGMILCDNRRIGTNSSSYTTKVATEDGTISTATVSQRMVFTYGSYVYYQYSITGNGKTEYVMYQINSADRTSFSNIFMSDALIYSTTITNVGKIFAPCTDFNTQKSFYVTCANTSGTISSALVNYRLSLYDYVHGYVINGTYFFWRGDTQLIFHQSTWIPTILEFDSGTSDPSAYLFNMANMSSSGTYTCYLIKRNAEIYYNKQLVLSLINSSFVSFWKADDTNKKYFVAPGSLRPGERNSIDRYVNTSTYNVSAYTDTKYIIFLKDADIWSGVDSSGLYCEIVENNNDVIKTTISHTIRSNVSKKIHDCSWDWWWGAAVFSSRQQGDHTVTANIATYTYTESPFTIETITSAINNYDIGTGNWHWAADDGDDYTEGGTGGKINGPNCYGHCRYYPDFDNLMANHEKSKDLYKKYKVTRTDTSAIQYTSHNHAVTLTNVK